MLIHDCFPSEAEYLRGVEPRARVYWSCWQGRWTMVGGDMLDPSVIRRYRTRSAARQAARAYIRGDIALESATSLSIRHRPDLRPEECRQIVANLEKAAEAATGHARTVLLNQVYQWHLALSREETRDPLRRTMPLGMDAMRDPEGFVWQRQPDGSFRMTQLMREWQPAHCVDGIMVGHFAGRDPDEVLAATFPAATAASWAANGLPYGFEPC